MIDTGKLEFAGALHDPANFLAKTGVTGPVHLTMINGRVVYKDGALTGVDETRLTEEAEETCTRVIRNRSQNAFR